MIPKIHGNRKSQCLLKLLKSFLRALFLLSPFPSLKYHLICWPALPCLLPCHICTIWHISASSSSVIVACPCPSLLFPFPSPASSSSIYLPPFPSHIGISTSHNRRSSSVTSLLFYFDIPIPCPLSLARALQPHVRALLLGSNRLLAMMDRDKRTKTLWRCSLQRQLRTGLRRS